MEDHWARFCEFAKLEELTLDQIPLLNKYYEFLKWLVTGYNPDKQESCPICGIRFHRGERPGKYVKIRE